MAIQITPSSALVSVGQSVQFSGPSGVKWSIAPIAVAQISASGLATGTAVGVATVTGRKGNQTGTAVLMVVAAAPQGCVLSEWALASAGPWSPCVDGQQTREEVWTRVVLTPPAYGGAPCGPLSEVRLVSRACTTSAQLTLQDLTLVGQISTGNGTQYASACLALRYVGGERRFLVYQFLAVTAEELIGDLVEYRIPPGQLMNGPDHWTLANVPEWEEVRRWRHWTTIPRLKAGAYSRQFRTQGAAGVRPAGFFFVPGADDSYGWLWYSLVPEYAGGEVIWPAWNCTKLTDSEAFTTAPQDVSDAHLHGPYYFRDSTVADDWKDAAHGIVPIPLNRQAAMGGTHLILGAHQANIGAKGPRSLSMWVVPGLPDMATSPPPPDAVLFPTAVHLYDTSTSSGLAAPNVRTPTFSENAGYHGANNSQDFFTTAPSSTAVHATEGAAVGLAVNDAIYCAETYTYIDCVSVFMNTGAQGGVWVPEIYVGGAWRPPSGWAVSHGAADLSGHANVFYWPKQAYAASSPDGLPLGNYVRLRRSSAGVSGGQFAAAIASVSMNGIPDTQVVAKPRNVGGYSVASPQYDATHYSHQYTETVYGGAWVQTSSVEGFPYAGSYGTGGYMYTGMPVYAQPDEGGTPIRYDWTDAARDWGNGPRYSGPRVPMFSPFHTDHLLAAAADPAKRFTTFLNPTEYVPLYAQWPAVIAVDTIQNPDSPYAGQAHLWNYYNGTSMVWDPVARQLLLVLWSYGKRQNILVVWEVPA